MRLASDIVLHKPNLLRIFKKWKKAICTLKSTYVQHSKGRQDCIKAYSTVNYCTRIRTCGIRTVSPSLH